MNRTLALAIILCLVACIAPLAADTADGFSNTFSIDNTAGAPPAVPSTAVSPYTAGSGNLLRGQFHSHARCDRGPWGIPLGNDLTYSQLCGRYDYQGMDFLGITDHNSISSASSPYSGLMWIPRCDELTYDAGHILALDVSTESHDNLASGSYTGNNVADLSRRIKNVKDTYGGLAFIAHPDGQFTKYNISLTDLSSIFGMARPDGLAAFSWDTRMLETWNRLVDSGWQIWGYSEDDYHDQWPNRVIGRTWIGVPHAATTVTWSEVRQNLSTGNYYLYWVEGGLWPDGKMPPQMHVSVSYPEPGRPKISVTLSGIEDAPPSGTHFLDLYGCKHWDSLIRTRRWTGWIPHDGTYEYQCNGREKFIRVEASLDYTFGTLKISSQPILVNRTGNPYGGALRVTATSPELILRFLDPSEKPTPPPAGYIGDAYEVSSTTGSVPPAASLDLSFDAEDVSALGGTHCLAIYRYDVTSSAWMKVGGTVDPGTATVTSPISQLGSYTISADLPPDMTAPEVFIDSPVTGGVVNADTEAKVTVNDDLGAWRVEFLMNGHRLAVDTDALDGWGVSLRYADYCTGDWTLKAVAEDLAGNRGETEIPIFVRSQTPRPTVTITSPSAGVDLSGVFTATGTCGDDVAVAQVTLYADDTPIGYGELDEAGTAWTAQIDTSFLANGARTLRAVAEDYPGNEASASITVTVNNGSISLPGLMGLPYGQTGRVNGLIVTAGTPEMGGFFCAQAADRSRGLMFLTDRVVPEGSLVNLAAQMENDGGLRRARTTDVTIVSTVTELPAPLGTYVEKFRSGVRNIGLLVRVWGTITAAPEGAEYFYLDDGSSYLDGNGSVNDASGNRGTRVYGTPPANPVGKRVSVTGVGDLIWVAPLLQPVPIIRTRRAGDIAQQH